MIRYKSFFENDASIADSLSAEASQILKDGPYIKEQNTLSWFFWNKPLDKATKDFNRLAFTKKQEPLVITLNRVLKELKKFKLLTITPNRDYGKRGSHDKPTLLGYNVYLSSLGYSVRKSLNEKSV